MTDESIKTTLLTQEYTKVGERQRSGTTNRSRKNTFSLITSFEEDDDPEEPIPRHEVRRYAKLYKKFDKDGDGVVAGAELPRLCEMLGFSANEQVKVMKLFQVEDGAVSFTEFLRVISKMNPALMSIRSKLASSLRVLDPTSGKKTKVDLYFSREGGSTGARDKFRKICELEDSPFMDRVIDWFFSLKETFDIDETMNWLTKIAQKGSPEEKGQFLFYMYDYQNSGVLDKDALTACMRQIIKENRFAFNPEVANELIESLSISLKITPENPEVSVEEFVEFICENSHLVDSLSMGAIKVSKEQFVVYDEPEGEKTKLPKNSKRLKVKRMIDRIYNYYDNLDMTLRYSFIKFIRVKFILEGWKWFLSVVWLSLTIYFMTIDFIANNQPKYNNVSGYAVPIAKACGSGLRFNCHMLLIPVCHKLMGSLRTIFPFLPTYLFDKHISMHKRVAIVTAILSVVHTLAHAWNAWRMGTEPWDIVNKAFDLSRFSQLGPGAVNIWMVLFTTIPGLTGILICAIMVVMYYCATVARRQENYERFWWTHHLFVLFFGLNIVHGFAQLVGPPKFWHWSVGICTLYALDRVWRWFTHYTVEVHEAKAEKSQVLSLQLVQPKRFRYRTGQYAYLACPDISKSQFHPFTISSDPSDPYVTFHVKQNGDFTKQLYDKFCKPPYPRLILDGPYGAAAQHFKEFQVVLLFAAGIGVTPYASVLSCVRAMLQRGEEHLPNVHFYWTARDQFSFSWFGKLISELTQLRRESTTTGEQQKTFAAPLQIENTLDLNLYLTGSIPETDVRNVLMRIALENVYRKTGIDPVTGIGKVQTHFGRPDFEEIFLGMCDTYPKKNIGVFCCGAPQFCNTIHNKLMSVSGVNNTYFYYYKEIFS